MKKNKIPLLIGISIVVLFVLLGVLIKMDSSNGIEGKSVSDWIKDTKNEKVVTVLGLTTCSHCQEYKPKIISLAKKNNINLYFFELDTLSEEDRKTVVETYTLDEYEGSVPFTFIIDKGVYKDSRTGFSNITSIENFLSENGVL